MSVQAKEDSVDNARPDMRCVAPGHTRDCLFPWTTVFIHADRLVRPCCIAPVIDKIDGEWNLEKVINGENFRNFRKNFIEGNLVRECDTCPIAREIPVSDFKNTVSKMLEGS